MNQQPSRASGTVLFCLAVVLVVATVVCVATGPVAVSFDELWQMLKNRLAFFQAESVGFKQSIVESVRLPRVVLALAAGAALASAGAIMQGMFRNPLADPGLLGVSAGGSLAAVSVIVLGPTLLGGWVDLMGNWALPVAAFIGSSLAMIAVYQMSVHDGRVVIPTMLLAGVALNALAGALLGYLTYLSDEQQLRMLTFWTMGSVGSASWASSAPAIIIMVVAAVLSLSLARSLNAMLLGEADAEHLGINIASVKRRVVLLCALGVGAAVSACGIISFVGLVCPHILRMLVGPDHRYLLPGSAMLGAVLLVLSDLAARMVVIPAELPLGVVTAMIGAPFLFWLLRRSRGAGWA